MYKMMTPGPTQVKEHVRLTRAREFGNPDLDGEFVEFYKETCELISRLLHTGNETLILGGEDILDIEAACASLTEQGDRALDNGIFGKGFADFVSAWTRRRFTFFAAVHRRRCRKERARLHLFMQI